MASLHRILLLLWSFHPQVWRLILQSYLRNRVSNAFILPVSAQWGEVERMSGLIKKRREKIGKSIVSHTTWGGRWHVEPHLKEDCSRRRTFAGCLRVSCVCFWAVTQWVIVTAWVREWVSWVMYVFLSGYAEWVSWACESVSEQPFQWSELVWVIGLSEWPVYEPDEWLNWVTE